MYICVYTFMGTDGAVDKGASERHPGKGLDKRSPLLRPCQGGGKYRQRGEKCWITEWKGPLFDTSEGLDMSNSAEFNMSGPSERHPPETPRQMPPPPSPLSSGRDMSITGRKGPLIDSPEGLYMSNSIEFDMKGPSERHPRKGLDKRRPLLRPCQWGGKC